MASLDALKEAIDDMNRAEYVPDVSPGLAGSGPSIRTDPRFITDPKRQGWYGEPRTVGGVSQWRGSKPDPYQQVANLGVPEAYNPVEDVAIMLAGPLGLGAKAGVQFATRLGQTGLVGPDITKPWLWAWGQKAYPLMEELVKAESKGINKKLEELTERTLVKILPETKDFVARIPAGSRGTILEQTQTPMERLSYLISHEGSHLTEQRAATQNPAGVKQALSELFEMAPSSLQQGVIKVMQPTINAAKKIHGDKITQDVINRTAASEIGASLTSYLRGNAYRALRDKDAWMFELFKAFEKDPRAIQKMADFWTNFLKDPLAYGSKEFTGQGALSDVLDKMAYLGGPKGFRIGKQVKAEKTGQLSKKIINEAEPISEAEILRAQELADVMRGEITKVTKKGAGKHVSSQVRSGGSPSKLDILDRRTVLKETPANQITKVADIDTTVREVEEPLEAAIRGWLTGTSKEMPRPTNIYRGVLEGSQIGVEGDIVHGTPWPSVGRSGGKVGGGGKDVYSVPATPDTIYYRGGSLAGDPLERTKIKNVQGMTWDEVMKEAKELYQLRVKNIRKQRRGTGNQLSSEDLDWIADGVIQDIRNATYETNLGEASGIWRGKPVTPRLDRETPPLRSYDDLRKVVAEKRKRGLADEDIPELQILKQEPGKSPDIDRRIVLTGDEIKHFDKLGITPSDQVWKEGTQIYFRKPNGDILPVPDAYLEHLGYDISKIPQLRGMEVKKAPTLENFTGKSPDIDRKMALVDKARKGKGLDEIDEAISKARWEAAKSKRPMYNPEGWRTPPGAMQEWAKEEEYWTAIEKLMRQNPGMSVEKAKHQLMVESLEKLPIDLERKSVLATEAELADAGFLPNEIKSILKNPEAPAHKAAKGGQIFEGGELVPVDEKLLATRTNRALGDKKTVQGYIDALQDWKAKNPNKEIPSATLDDLLGFGDNRGGNIDEVIRRWQNKLKDLDYTIARTQRQHELWKGSSKATPEDVRAKDFFDRTWFEEHPDLGVEMQLQKKITEGEHGWRYNKMYLTGKTKSHAGVDYVEVFIPWTEKDIAKRKAAHKVKSLDPGDLGSREWVPKHVLEPTGKRMVEQKVIEKPYYDYELKLQGSKLVDHIGVDEFGVPMRYSGYGGSRILQLAKDKASWEDMLQNPSKYGIEYIKKLE